MKIPSHLSAYPFYPTCHLLLLISLCLTLNGCGTKTVFPPSATRPQPTSGPTTRHQGTVQEARTSVPIEHGRIKPVVLPNPQLGPAGSLYKKAEQHLAKGSYRQAELALERALRVEPRNGYYWYSLARTKFGQKQYAQARQLCYKSKTAAGGDKALIEANDFLISQTKRKIIK